MTGVFLLYIICLYSFYLFNNHSHFHARLEHFLTTLKWVAATPFQIPLWVVSYIKTFVPLTLGCSFDTFLFGTSRPNCHCLCQIRLLTTWHLYRCFTFRYYHTSIFHPYCSDRALGFTGFRCVLKRIFLYAQVKVYLLMLLVLRLAELKINLSIYWQAQ